MPEPVHGDCTNEIDRLYRGLRGSRMDWLPLDDAEPAAVVCQSCETFMESSRVALRTRVVSALSDDGRGRVAGLETRGTQLNANASFRSSTYIERALVRNLFQAAAYGRCLF